MEEGSGPEAPPDLSAVEVFRNELTRTNSDSSSVTIDMSKKNLIRRNTNCTTWTNEKHNSYLASLEASFVKQLHQSLGLLSWSSEQNTCESAFQQLPVNASYSSDQFTVPQDGFWKKINIQSIPPLPYNAAGSHAVKECSDLREGSTFCGEGMISRGKRILSHRLLSLERQCVCHKRQEDAVGGTAEVSDQNFVDECPEEESSGLSNAKRLKVSAADSSTNEQIGVPFGNAFSAEISKAAKHLSERGASASRMSIRKLRELYIPRT